MRWLPRRSGLPVLVWPFVLVVLVQMAIAVTSVYTLSAVRAYVAGESAWSKGYKDAIHNLEKFAETGSASHHAAFRAAIAVPLADLDARLALESAAPDREAARIGFAGGGNHEADIPAMIWLFLNFENVSYLRDAIDQWKRADQGINAISALGEEIGREREAGEPSPAQVEAWMTSIASLNAHILPLTIGFQEALGRGSRAIARILLVANLVTGALLIGLAIWRTGKLMRQSRRFERALDAERRRAQATLSSIGQAVISVRANGQIDYLNPVAEALLETTAAEALGKPLGEVMRVTRPRSDIIDHDFIARVAAALPVATGAEPRNLALRDGSLAPVSIVASPVPVGRHRAGAVVVINDMARERAFMDQLAWQANHDDLTGLLNRRGFEEELEGIASSAPRDVAPATLMCFDLDQFKIVNDTCGHAAGDALLKQVAGLFRRHVKGSDVVARLGGDEFGLILRDCALDDAVRVAEAIRAAVEAHAFDWNGRPFSVSTSIGVVSLMPGQSDGQEVLRAADLACYLAKEKGRNRIHVNTGSDTELEEHVGQMAWVQRIRAALDQDRFVLYKQPIVALNKASAGYHCEVLLRLRDETGKIVPPALFIPPAERYGLMPLIDRWVVQTAIAALARNGADGQISTCAINLSGATFGDAGFVDFVRAQFAAHGVDPRVVCFEITETSAIDNLDAATHFIAAMKRLGCRFSLDDFGSGMSSFAYLKHLPVDYLKIDGSFVRDMLDDRVDQAMVEMIHHIGKVTGKLTIAECVETDAVARRLADIGIDFAQGYAFARPSPFDEGLFSGTDHARTEAEAPPLRLRA